MQNWRDYLDIMASGTQQQKDNWTCWMQRYLSGCTTCPACKSSDPFGPYLIDP